MKTLIYTLIAIVLAINTAFTQSDNQIIVQLHQDNDIKDLTVNHQLHKGQTTGLHSKMRLSKHLNIWLLEFDGQKIDVRNLLAQISTDHSVRAAQLNHPVQHRAVPNDPSYTSQWQYDNDGLENRVSDADIDAPSAWDLTTGGTTITDEEIVVAVIDFSVEKDHPDLINNIWTNPYETLNGEDDDNNGYADDLYGWNFDSTYLNNNITNSRRGNGHGTSVMGIIGAEGNNGIGVTGINWNTKVMNLVALDDAGVIASYDYILDMRTRYNRSGGTDGAFIVCTNTSLGRLPKGNNEDFIWCSMYDALGEAGIVSAGATDNRLFNVDTEGDIPSGCSSEYLITVTNTDARDRKVAGAGYGLLSVDLSAPGNGTYTVVPGGEGTFSGTSAATPHVAGAVALLYSMPIPEFMNDVRQNPQETARLIKNFILQSVDPLPDLQGITVTGGRLNLYNSLLKMQEHYDFEGGALPKGAIAINAVSPNPTTDIAQVQIRLYETSVLTLKILNTLGQQVHKQSYGKTYRGTHLKTLSFNTLPKGIYFITATADNFGTIAVQKIMVE